MPSALKRLYNRLSRAKGSEDMSLNGQRRRALTIPLPEGAREQKTEDQCQSAFFAKLPLEIRQLIYMELLRGEVDVVHVTKQPRKPLEFTRCASKCSMTYNYKCWAGEVPDGRRTTMKASSTLERGLFPLLQTCRRAYTEAISILYSYYLFDFRSFDAFIHLSQTLLPQHWNAIKKMHLIWHFGYGIWEPERYKSNPAWSKVWNTLSHGPKLNELQVDLDAYLGTTISPFVEAQVFEPLMAVAVSSKFVVKVSWPRSPETPANVKLPFRLEKPANNLDLVINDHEYDPTDV